MFFKKTLLIITKNIQASFVLMRRGILLGCNLKQIKLTVILWDLLPGEETSIIKGIWNNLFGGAEIMVAWCVEYLFCWIKKILVCISYANILSVVHKRSVYVMFSLAWIWNEGFTWHCVLCFPCLPTVPPWPAKHLNVTVSSKLAEARDCSGLFMIIEVMVSATSPAI